MDDDSNDSTASGGVAPSYPPFHFLMHPTLRPLPSSGSGASDGGIIDDWPLFSSPDGQSLHPNDWIFQPTPANEGSFPNDWTAFGPGLGAVALGINYPQPAPVSNGSVPAFDWSMPAARQAINLPLPPPEAHWDPPIFPQGPTRAGGRHGPGLCRWPCVTATSDGRSISHDAGVARTAGRGARPHTVRIGRRSRQISIVCRPGGEPATARLTRHHSRAERHVAATGEPGVSTWKLLCGPRRLGRAHARGRRSDAARSNSVLLACFEGVRRTDAAVAISDFRAEDGDSRVVGPVNMARAAKRRTAMAESHEDGGRSPRA
jgi:hypothetical protein